MIETGSSVPCVNSLHDDRCADGSFSGVDDNNNGPTQHENKSFAIPTISAYFGSREEKRPKVSALTPDKCEASWTMTSLNIKEEDKPTTTQPPVRGTLYTSISTYALDSPE